MEHFLSMITAADGPPAAVSYLKVCVPPHHGGLGSWGHLLSPAFPTVTALEQQGAQLGTNALQGLSQCSRLSVQCVVGGLLLQDGVTSEDLRSWLPEVHDLTVSSPSTMWLGALAPQLKKLSVADCEEHPIVVEQLARCTQMVEIFLPAIDQATLEVPLGLGSLRRVACMHWRANARGLTCSWMRCHVGNIGVPGVADSLPLGIDTLDLFSLTVHAAAAPTASFEAAHMLAGGIARACRTLSWDNAHKSPRIHVQLRCPLGLMEASIVAALRGLRPLYLHLSPGLCLQPGDSMHMRRPFDGDPPQSLPFDSGSLSVQGSEDDWEPELPEALPQLRTWIPHDPYGNIAALSQMCCTSQGALCDVVLVGLHDENAQAARVHVISCRLSLQVALKLWAECVRWHLATTIVQ